jgi:hypothetical protein
MRGILDPIIPSGIVAGDKLIERILAQGDVVQKRRYGNTR